MYPQESQQVAARDEEWLLSAERVKISSANIRLETTAQDTDSYEFLLAKKKCTINAEVFRTILNICLRVEGEDFTNVLDDETTLTFLIDLSYKGPLNRHTNMFCGLYVLAVENYGCYSQQIPPKKSRGKGSKGKKTTEESQETIDVSEESEPEPEPAKKNTSGKRRVKKKVTLSADDNIISDDPDVALELAKSLVVRSSKSVVIQDTPSTLKSKPATSKTKLKGAPSLTPQEQEAADIMQALKESKKTSRRQPGTEGLNEETGSKPGVLDESTVVSATSSEGTGTKPGVLNKDKDITEEKDDKDGDADDEGNDHISDTQDADDEDDETESDENEIYKNAAKKEAEKTSEAKDDTKKSELPPSSSSLSVSSGFGDQFLKLSSDSSLVSTVKDSADADADVSSLLDIPIQHKTPQTQTPLVQKIPVSVILETTNLPPIPVIVTDTPVSTTVPSP
nr:hypothetical protein [Tanacetum cinerariifolium]